MERVRIIKKGMSSQEIKKVLDLSDIPEPRGVDTDKYCGVLNWKIDPVEYQRKIRSEWDREIKLS